MANIQRERDTIFEHQAFRNFPPVSSTAPASVQGGRLMSSGPHVDGLVQYATGDIDVTTTGTALAKTRNAKGDWSFNLGAVGVQTIFARATLADVLRTGEQYFLELFPNTNQTTSPNAPDKGFAIADFFCIYSVGTAALTTATLRLGKTVYSKTAGGAAFVQTDLVAATGIQTATTPSLAQYTWQDVAFQNNSSGAFLVFHKDDLGVIEIEANFVTAATTTLQIAAIGVHVFFNFN